MKDFVRKNYGIILTAAVLILLYIGFVFIAPRMSLWNYSFVYDPSDSVYTDLHDGDEYALSFNMSFDRISKVELLFNSGELDLGSNIVPMDADLELCGQDGNIIYSKHITSLYDTSTDNSPVNVVSGSPYVIRFKVNTINAEAGDDIPQIKVSSSGSFAFKVYGCHNGTSDKTLFTAVYLIFSAVIILYISSYKGKSKELRSLSEKLLFLCISLASILILGQALDLEMISRSAFKMIEALKAGNFLDYYNYSYSTALSDGSDFIHLGYNYDFFLVFPVAVVLFPFSFFFDSHMPYWQGYYAVSVVLTIFVFLLILLSSKLAGKICEVCGMSSEYGETVRKFFLFSPFILCASLVFGQIDMLYVAAVLYALIMYYKGQYKKFTFIMSFAVSMKLFPLMIFIPLILLVKKKPLEIIAHLIGVMSVPLLSALIFKHGAGYHAIMNIVDSEYGFMDMLLGGNIDGKNALFPIIYAFICIFAFAHSPIGSAKDLLKTSMITVFASYAAFAVFSTWHFQWFIPMFLALAFLLPMYSGRRAVLLLGIVFEILMILTITGNDQLSIYELNYLLPVFTDHDYHGVFVSEMLTNIHEGLYVLITSLTTAVAAALCYIFFKGDKEDVTDEGELIKFRFAGTVRITVLYALVAFFIWCYCYIG